MSEQKIVVGIDAGSAKIVTVVGKVDEEGVVNVLGVAEVTSSGIKKGQIVDIDEAVTAMSNSLDGAERMAGHSISHVVASIGGSHIESLNSKGVVAVANAKGEIEQSDLERVIDAARAVSFPTTREIIHVLPRFYTVDGQEGIKDPIGMTGVRLEVDTHLVSASSTAIRNFEKALSEVGVEVDGFAFSGFASSLAVLSATEKELGVVLIDIGAGTTDISVYIEGAVAYSAVLPIGARHITNDIAIGLRVSLESAEKIKLFLSRPVARKAIGLAPEEEKEKKHDDELDLSSLHLDEEVKKVSQKTLLDGIIRPRLNEIFTMVGAELRKSGLGGQTPAGLVITGGGAKTVGIVDAAKRMLAMPVRIGYPTDIKGIVDEAQDTSFATAIGLLRYGATLTNTKQSFNFSMPKLGGLPKIGGTGKLGKQILNLLKSFIP